MLDIDPIERKLVRGAAAAIASRRIPCSRMSLLPYDLSIRALAPARNERFRRKKSERVAICC